jgi:hypothetical protein
LADNLILIAIVYFENVEGSGLQNATGYGTADMKLMSLEYHLFNDLPIKFCGDWIYKGAYNWNSCPGDGTYDFNVPYTLPPSQDMTTWFATGWSGSAYLSILAEKGDANSLIASCEMHLSTYTTTSRADGWKSLPSAATASMAVVATIAAMVMICCCLACRKSRKYVTDEPTQSEYVTFEEDEMKKEKEKKEGIVHML